MTATSPATNGPTKRAVLRRVEASKSPPLVGIQVGRAVAALLVVLYHGGKMLSLPQYLGHIPLGNVFSFGHAGVDFFFVLSGFIITYVHRTDVGRPARLLHYTKRRITRIYPIYWVVTAIVIAIALATPEGRDRLQPGHIVASLLLWPHGQDPLLGVAWTLQSEMLFYVLFGLAILNRRLGLCLLGGGLLLVSASMVSPSLSGFFGNAYNLLFVMGIASAMIVQGRRVLAPRLMIGVGIMGFLLVGMSENAGLLVWAGVVSIVLFGLCSAVIVVGLAQAERARLIHFGRAPALLGDASYSLYLVHTIVIGLAARLMASLHLLPVMPDWSMVILVTGASVAAALALHLLMEKPLLATIRRAGFG